MSELILSQLYCYPVKSLAGFSTQHSEVEAFGLRYDRRWMVVDAKTGDFITQRSHPKMALIQAEKYKQRILLRHKEGLTLQVSIPDGDLQRNVTVWGDHCLSWDAGDEAAHWLSDLLQVDCRLVYFPDDEVRQVDLDYAKAGDKTAFSDGFPLLLISQASLDDLNRRLEEPVEMIRFRPNLVVSGCEPFAEDSWRRIRIGDVTMRVVKPCSRCSIPNVNPKSGRREKEPALTLSKYRQRDNKIFFGQNVIADNSGMIEVGMQVEIIE